ncbi:response regulator [Marinobacterium sp. D7]|uniref:response regulator n=1 Tax=Marinobacterium ramblicola TaxID=2849041 RepID=UPI001C2CFF40|nr:response regulator [Marinobacterium ramblicola]MBV1787959.1 response regulator [Marinobacterium ramblicola]
MSNRSILIAAEDVDDAEVIFEMLRREFDNLAVSTDPDKAVEDFEAHCPAVLVLAFTSLAKAQAYYLGLYRLSTQVHTMAHRTVILCSKGELEQVYALCKKGYYSNYVLFWPLGYDSTRLAMEVHHALEQMSTGEEGSPTPAEFAAQARRIAGLEALLKENMAKGSEHIDLAGRSFDQAGEKITVALNGFTQRLAEDRSAGATGSWDRATYEAVIDRLAKDLEQLKREKIGQSLDSAKASIQPMRQWAEQFKQELEPQLESVRAIQKMCEAVRPLVLVVDDDDYQQKLLGQILSGAGVELLFASSSNEALSLLHRRRPDLVLMDVGLPDVNGIETTRRLKSVKRFAAIPVVMITGHHGQKEVVIQSRRVGAADFVVKPIDKAVLLRKIDTYLKASDSG